MAGLAAIHAAGIVHRDLKPGNVFLHRDGTVKIMDLGLARQSGFRTITVRGVPLGTPEYVAPEQIRDSRRADARSDLFNVGLIMYEMLTRHSPFEAEYVEDVMVRVLQNRASPITDFRQDLTPELMAWIDTLLAHRPADRFPSAESALAAL
ncbi:MAG: serine/threonine-protein kinase [Candidatus Xenobia bacterium]